MKATSQGGFVLVSVSGDDTSKFNDSWPCSPIPDDSTFLFEFSSRNGDLVNITMHLDGGEYADSSEYDGDALLALSNDAMCFACSGGHLPQWVREVRNV